MGEHATYDGSTIKIGTCENLYYLRADQRHLIEGYDFSEEVFRYRFPFPDEDSIEPGRFDEHNRGVRIPGWELPFDEGGPSEQHHSVQFTSTAGYVLSISCPEGVGGDRGFGPVDVDGVQVHRNGFRGHPVICQQRFFEGRLVTIGACGACGAKWRLDKLEAGRVVECFRTEAERREYRRDGWEFANSDHTRAFLLEMAARIEAGYKLERVTLNDAATMLEP